MVLICCCIPNVNKIDSRVQPPDAHNCWMYNVSLLGNGRWHSNCSSCYYYRYPCCCCCCVGPVSTTTTSSHSDTTTDHYHPLLAAFDSCLTFAATQVMTSLSWLIYTLSSLKWTWICIVHRREHASNVLPLPVSRRWSPQASASARHQWTLQDHCHAMCLFTLPTFAGYSFQHATDGGLRLSRPGCLVPHRGGLPVQRRRSPTQALTRPSVE